VDGSPWNDKRDVALINVMARAGLRVSETSCSRSRCRAGARLGNTAGKRGQEGLKVRTQAVSAEAGGSAQAYLKVRPQEAGYLLFLSRTHRALDPGDVQRMYLEQRDGQESSSQLHHALPGAESRRHRHPTTILGVRQYQPMGDRMSPQDSSDLHDNALSASKYPPGSEDGGRDVVAHRPAELGMKIKMGVRCRSTHPVQSHHS
jgi:hypothetical protein